MNLLWKKRLQSAGWLTLVAAGIVLLVAGVQRKVTKECLDVKVEVSGENNHVFLDEREVLKILNANGELVGQRIEDINLQLLEKRLELDRWISNAELFFDNKQVLQVLVEEKEPVARIFTVGGNSYYIDSAAKRLPLSDKVSIRVPMFTNFPAEGKRLASKDSALLQLVKTLAMFIEADSFWNAQVAQIDITPDRTFEMVPTIGNHIVALGSGDDIEKKFDRLMTFYKQVWTKVGLERYSRIDVQYDGQVVGTRKGEALAAIDTGKVKEAFINLVNRNRPDTIEDRVAVVKSTLADAVKKEIEAVKKKEASKEDSNNEEKKVQEQKKKQEKAAKPVPKAVMKKVN
jgi:cell division protein FtsQ